MTAYIKIKALVQTTGHKSIFRQRSVYFSEACNKIIIFCFQNNYSKHSNRAKSTHWFEINLRDINRTNGYIIGKIKKVDVNTIKNTHKGLFHLQLAITVLTPL